MRYYVTGDIHGFLTPLKEALSAAGYFDYTGPKKLVILGDMLDRGTEVLETIDFILDLMKQDAVILIRGNHEDLYSSFVTYDRALPMSHHLHNGTFDTAMTLAGFDRLRALERNEEFALAARNNDYYNTIIPATLNYYEAEHYIFVHGWIPCDHTGALYTPYDDWRNASEADWRRARWHNGMDAFITVHESKTILCGHFHTSYGHYKYDGAGSEFGPDADFSPFYAPGIIALDACTAHSGRVNCVVIDD